MEQRPGKEGKWSWVCWVATLSHLGDRNYPSVSLHGDTLSSLVTVVVSILCIYGVDPPIFFENHFSNLPTIRSLNFPGHQSTFRAQIIRSSIIFGDLHRTPHLWNSFANMDKSFLVFPSLKAPFLKKESLNFDKAMIACHKLSLKESSSRLEIPPETRMESSFKGR